MNLRPTPIAALPLAAALLLTACNKQEGGQQSPATNAPPATTTPGAAPTGAPPAAKTAPPADQEPPPRPDALPAPEDHAAPPADAAKTPTGLASKVLKAGTGKDHPAATDKVSVHYTGWTAKSGRMFDSSVTRGEPATFPLNRVIPGWTEGVQLMVEGEKRRFWIPANLAYGDVPKRPGAPAGMLVFDVELLKIVKPQPPPAVPKDVAAAPKDAKTTPSGLAYKVLTKGKGATHPTDKDVVQVDYSGWTTKGEMFDSSVTRGEPAVFPLGGVIKGWTEGVQLMVEGEKTRFWIPAALAYGDNPGGGAPSGMLVFDIELRKIMSSPK